MIAIQQRVFEALAGFVGLGNLVGARIYPDIAPQDTLKPYVTWQEISLVQANDLGGSVESNGLNNYRVSVTSWAASPKGGTQARDVDAQVKLAMIAGTGFKSLMIDTRALDYESDTKLHGVQSDFSVWLKT